MMTRGRLCRAAALVAVLALQIMPGTANGQEAGGTATRPPAESWAGQLETLTRWLEERRHEARCEQRCFVLDELLLSGDLSEGQLSFTLSGAVLADGPVAVPLFGPPDQIRLDQATLAAGPAQVGFEDQTYFLFAEPGAFTLRGRITLRGDLALFVAGPLNSLDTSITGGRVVEGERLSGLSQATIHFERGTEQEQTREEPTVFQLARALRVGREVAFEYQLTMRSGNDLGVVRLPLRFGEEVLEVSGSTGWRVEEGVLLLPTAGRQAEITITGSLDEVGTFTPDERSAYEWWLFENDAEHRLTIEGQGRQFDVAESPISRSQPSSRLFMVSRGQQIEVSVQSLVGAEVLGAVVQRQDRTVVLTRQGDLVAEDQLTYENNGIDYLLFQPRGRAIFLATDQRAERIMHKQSGDDEIMIPLRTGTHQVKVQSLGEHQIGRWGGALSVPMPGYPLTASRATLRLGLPRFVHPLVLLGGDETRWFVGLGDALAVLLGLLAAVVVLRGRRRRLLGGLVLAGLWFISEPLFVLALVTLALGGGLWVLTRFLSGGKLILAVIVGVAVLGFVGILSLVTFSMRGEDSGISAAAPSMPRSLDAAEAVSEEAASTWDNRRSRGGGRGEVIGNRMAQVAVGGVLEGVTPVALPLPGYQRSVWANRELVTDERPFQPTLYYLTAWTLLPFGLAWLACLLALGLSYRQELSDLYRRARQRLASGPVLPTAAPAIGQPAAPVSSTPPTEAEDEKEKPSLEE